MVRLVKQKFGHMTRFPTLSVRILAKAAADRDVCVVRGMQLNFNFQKTGARAEIVWLFIFQSLLVVPYRTIE